MHEKQSFELMLQHLNTPLVSIIDQHRGASSHSGCFRGRKRDRRLYGIPLALTTMVARHMRKVLQFPA